MRSPQRTVRQLAEHLRCAIGDAEQEHRYEEDAGIRLIRVGDAAIEALEDFGLSRAVLEDAMNKNEQKV